MIWCRLLEWLRQNINQSLYSQKTPYTSPSRERCGVSIVRSIRLRSNVHHLHKLIRHLPKNVWYMARIFTPRTISFKYGSKRSQWVGVVSVWVRSCVLWSSLKIHVAYNRGHQATLMLQFREYHKISRIPALVYACYEMVYAVLNIYAVFHQVSQNPVCHKEACDLISHPYILLKVLILTACIECLVKM